MSNRYTLYNFLKEASVMNATEIADYYEKNGKLPPKGQNRARDYFIENGHMPSGFKVHDVEYDRGPVGLANLHDTYSYKDIPAKKKLLSKRNIGIGAGVGLTAAAGGAYLLKKRRDRIKKKEAEKVAGFNPAVAQSVGGKALKAVSPVSTAMNTVSSAKRTAAEIANKQGRADDVMGVGGRFSKVAGLLRKKEKEEEDKRYSRLYKKKKNGLTTNQRAAIASGATLGALGMFGAIKHKDPLYVPKIVNRNKEFLGAKTVGALIKLTPFRDVAREAGNAIYDADNANRPQVDFDNLTSEDKIDESIRRGAQGNQGYAPTAAKMFGLALAATAGKKAGEAGVEYLREKVKAKKLAREKEEQEWLDAHSKNLKAADLFKKASIATGDDIVTAVNKSVEKFLPEEIRKREARRNRYNSTVDYVDHGAHGGDAPQRRNK